MAEITKIEPLNGKNYRSWKYNIKLVLMERGLWSFIAGNEEVPAETAAAAVRNSYCLRSDKASITYHLKCREEFTSSHFDHH